MKLTEHFTLEELMATSTGLLNNPNPVQIDALRQLAINVLEPLRMAYGQPIKINSGFRSIVVNVRVKGSLTSAHTRGEAADLSCINNAQLFNLIRSKLKFDQLIWEAGNDLQPNWVHVSFKKSGNRGEVLKMRNGQYTKM